MKYDRIKETLNSNKKSKVNKTLKDLEEELTRCNKRVQVMYNRLLSDSSLKGELEGDIKSGIEYIEYLKGCKKTLENHKYELYNEIIEYDIYDMKKQLGLE
ncbi:MAG: hypothetical protein J6B87_07055 [Clostridia bacterium]|nr:hypothetical protein [Clostridia bacterium]